MTVRALLLLAAAELRRSPSQTAVIGVVLACAAGTLALALALASGSGQPFERSFVAAGSPHLTVVSHNPDRLRAVRASDGLEAASGPFPQALGVLQARAGVRRSVVLRALPVEEPPVDRPLVRAGHWLSGPAEIVLERSFARTVGVEAGTMVTARVGDGSPLRLRVAGIAATAARGPYPTWTPGLVWIDRAVFTRLVPSGTETEQFIALRLVDPERFYLAVNDIRTAVPDARTITWQQVQEDVVEDARTASTLLGVLSAFALLAVGLVLANVVAGRVLARRRDLAMLRALGATPSQVATLLVCQQAGLAVIAGVPGVIAGLLLGRPLLERAADTLGAPTPSPVLPAVVAVLLVTIAAALFSLPAALRARRVAPLRALRGVGSERPPRRSRVAAAAASLRLPVAIVIGVQDAVVRRGRAILTVVSLMLTVATAVFALGMEATYARILSDPAVDGYPFQLRVLPGALGEPATRALLARHRAQIASDVTIARLPATADGETVQLRAFGGDVAAQPYNMREGRMPRAAGEAMVAPGVRGVHVGDRLALEVSGRPLGVHVVGVYVDASQRGRVVAVTRATLLREGVAIPPPAHALTVPVEGDPRRLASDLADDTQGLADIQVTSELYKAERAGVRPVVYGLLAVLLAVGLVNLLTTTMLTARERARDLATLKTIGMTPRQLHTGTSAGAGLLAVLAVCVGVPLGLGLFNGLVLLLSPVDGADVLTQPPLAQLLALVPGAVALAALAAYLPARAIARAPIGAALRLD
jgi:putative ABC transport system permease protein